VVASAKAPRCAACEAALRVPFVCEECGALFRAPARITAFERFGLPGGFEVDLEELERRFIELSRRLHPDRHMRKPAPEKIKALTLSAALNDAYNTLRSEHDRAEYLLKLAGGPTATESKSCAPGFLMATLDLREELEEARGQKDSLAALRSQVLPLQEGHLARIRGAFARADDEVPLDIPLLRQTLNELKYYDKLIIDIDIDEALRSQS